MAFRATVETYLRAQSRDPSGKLVVSEDGPRFQGKNEVFLSYSHTEGAALLVYSSQHALGVDIEREDREFSKPPLDLATRYFSDEETNALKKLSSDQVKKAFLDLWLKKEAYGKLTRKGLVYTLSLNLNQVSNVKFLECPVAPVGWIGCIAIAN